LRYSGRMTELDFQRARSTAAKRQREDAILDAARALGAERGIRQITLTEIADAVGMHKSALLRYFETREQIFLRLTADGWREWSAALRAELDRMARPNPAGTAGSQATKVHRPDPAAVAAVASAFAGTLAARGFFCDLLAQAPLNLERNVSVAAVRAFKLVTLTEVTAIVAAATSMSGAFWQMATPGPELETLYRSDPRLAHAVVEVEPRVTRLLEAMLRGTLA
jgi:AcrR family transcriptional regulator